MRYASHKEWNIIASIGLISIFAALVITISGQTAGNNNLLFFTTIAGSCILVFLIFNKHKITLILKSLYFNERVQSIALLESLNKMINKLEYRDHVLLEEKNQAEHANKVKSDFLVSMSHELRTPMHAILNFAEMGKDKTGDPGYEKLLTYFIRIEESGERLLRLIDGLLDLTRLESGKVNFKFEEKDIIGCLNGVCNEMSAILEKRLIKIKIQNNNINNQVLFDKDHIIRVLINLVSNAEKFSPDTGTIKISIENGRFNIGASKKIKGLKISVEDQGTGIAEDEKEMIFSKFIQGSIKSDKEAGSGLGLAICKEIIVAHGGNIWAENVADGGARISFVIPERTN